MPIFREKVKQCCTGELVLAAVNESVSDQNKSLEQSCVSWICDQNTLMRLMEMNDTNIRQENFSYSELSRYISTAYYTSQYPVASMK